jgi:hypothetical protein
MEQELHRVLQIIRDDLQDVGGGLQRGATEAEIEQVQNDTQRELGNPLPSSYTAFLKITNGLSWAGVAIFGTSASPIVGFPDRLISEFVEANTGFRISTELFKNYLVFGSDGDSLLTCDIRNGQYEVFTVFMAPLGRFDTFEEMICHVLRQQMG